MTPHDRTITRDELKAALPDDMQALVDQLPGCIDCDDVTIDGAVGWLMHCVTTMIHTQDQTWAAGAVGSCKRILDREFPQ